MTETIDVATWLMYLVEIYSDELKKEKVVLQLGRATGFDRKKVETLLDALFQVLAERLPEHQRADGRAFRGALGGAWVGCDP